AVPEVVVGQERGVGPPRRRRPPVFVLRAAGDARKLLVGCQASPDALQRAFGVDAVVVGERHDVGLEPGKGGVSGMREATAGANALEPECASLEERRDAGRLVLMEDG